MNLSQDFKSRYIRQVNTIGRKKDNTWFILYTGNKEVIELNESAGVLWEAFGAPQTVGGLVKRIMSLYDVKEDIATRDVRGFLDLCFQQGLIQKVES